jgi:hypothetical protein
MARWQSHRASTQKQKRYNVISSLREIYDKYVNNEKEL